MVAGRSVGVHDVTAQGQGRGYKPMDNHFDVGNPLHLGGYQAHPGTSGWSDGSHMPFDQNERFGAEAYNRFIGGATNYAPNAYNGNYQGNKTSLMPPSNSTGHVGNNNILMEAGIHNSTEMQADGARANAVAQGQQPAVDCEDVAQHFVFRYYSLLHSNPSGIFNLYAKTAQLCKPDLNGSRVVAVGHNEIKNYYALFSPSQITAVIRKIEVQSVGDKNALMILIVAELKLKIQSVPETQLVSQVVVLGSDQARVRYHILNDIAIINTRNQEYREQDKKKDDSKSTNNILQIKSRTTPPTRYEQLVQTADEGVINSQETRDKSKLIIFGLPSDITSDEVREALTSRMKSRANREWRILRVDLKKHYQNSEASPFYAFVHLDSSEAGEAVVGDNLSIRGCSLTVDFYKRNNTSKIATPNRANNRDQGKPSVW